MALLKNGYVDFVKKNRSIEQAERVFQQRIDDAKEIFAEFSGSFEMRPCPVCGHEAYAALDSFHETYGVVQCEQCTSQYVNPCPSLDALAHYYNHSECNAQLGEIFRSRVKAGSIILTERSAYVAGLIEELVARGKPIRVLEVGCSSGAFLSELKDVLSSKGIADRVELSGVDIDAEAVKRSVDPDLSLHTDSAEGFAEKNKSTFDLVMHFELLEHLIDPLSFMKAVQSMLNEGGYCHFHTPNANGFDNTALGYNDFRPLAHGIFPPMHLQAFTPQNILHFILRADFKLLQLDTPGNFDVDIVKRFHDRTEPSEFSFIEEFSEEQLGVVQGWLKRLYGSSHMRCTVTK